MQNPGNARRASRQGRTVGFTAEIGGKLLPGDLMEALHEMERDTFVLDTLGAHISKEYIEAKKQEWERFRMAVTDWEINHYLYRI